MSKELQFLIYNTPQNDVTVNVVVRDETIWLTQKAMAELFDVQTPAINKHLKNIFDEGELQKEATISNMEIVQNEGVRKVKRAIEYYNLDAIISVGYRKQSKKGNSRGAN
ncbi:MAG: virulence RhuM family protein [Burkholderiales bacterium]|nr:virulence RhuM family protein [Burkholderiales bacterium]